MGNFAPALLDFKKNLFTPKALLTGGVSLAVSGTKALMKGPEAPPAAPPLVPPPAPQAAQAASRVSAAGAAAGAGGGGMGAGAKGGTLLTGPGGIDPTTLNLGKNNLLGQ